MSDIHDLPLRGHDLPEYRPVPFKARVYRLPDGRWTWEHYCPWHSKPFQGSDHYSQKIAFRFAEVHLKGCL